MSYIDDTGDPDKGQSYEDELKPWPGYPVAHSFRVGMTPVICNNWFVENDFDLFLLRHIACDRDTDKRAFRQEWTTSWAPLDAPLDIKVKIGPLNERPWDLDTSNTAHQSNGTWAWEILHDYNGDYKQGNAIQYVYDSSHRVTLDNWTEWNSGVPWWW